MVTRKALYVKLAKTCLAAALAASITFDANAADANAISFKVTGVAVVLPPDTRVVVPSARHFALFRVEYDVPANMNARIFLGENCDTARLGLGFRTGASGLYKGTGTVAKPLGLDSEVYDKGVLPATRRSMSCSQRMAERRRTASLCWSPCLLRPPSPFRSCRGGRRTSRRRKPGLRRKGNSSSPTSSTHVRTRKARR